MVCRTRKLYCYRVYKSNKLKQLPPIKADSQSEQLKYSTDEIWTGKYWTDGKKIYSRVLQDNVIPINDTVAFSNVDKIINQYGSIKDNGIWLMIDRGEFNLTLNEQTHNVLYYFRYTAGASYDWYFTVEYTKTTD